MISRRGILATSLLAVPAILARPLHAAGPQTVKIGSILGGPNMAAFLLPGYLKKQSNIDAEVVIFPNIVQRMQAIASGDIQIGYGGINAAIGLAGRGTPLVLLSNATDGGWYLVGGPKVQTVADLKGKKVAVQAASISHICLQWKLKKEGIFDSVEVLGMNNNDMPIAMQRGDVDALMAFEPHASYTVMNGWAKPVWAPYDTPMGRLNLGVIATPDYVAKNPELTKAVIRAHKAATEDLMRDNTAAAEAIVKTLNMPMNVAVESLKNTFFTTDSGPAFVSNVKALGSMMIDAKMAQKLPDWGTFIDTTLINA